MKVISLLSSGIDSPVATHMALSKGLEVVAVHFWGEPYTDENALESFKQIVDQVASQTTKNLAIIDKAVKIPVLRPLIAFDKEDIVSAAKQINTYDISIQKGLCCGLVPKEPTTQSSLEEILEAEEKLGFDNMVKESVAELKWLNN